MVNAEILMSIIKNCKTHGALTEEQCVKAGKYTSGNPAYKCRQCLAKWHKTHYERNREKVLKKCEEYRKENPEKVKQMKKDWWKENLRFKREWRRKDKIANPQKYKKYEYERVVNLTDGYIKKILVKRTTLSCRDIPQEMIKAKRNLLQIKRIARNFQSKLTLPIEENENGTTKIEEN